MRRIRSPRCARAASGHPDAAPPEQRDELASPRWINDSALAVEIKPPFAELAKAPDGALDLGRVIYV
jgi:hypothetical protein